MYRSLYLNYEGYFTLFSSILAHNFVAKKARELNFFYYFLDHKKSFKMKKYKLCSYISCLDRYFHIQSYHINFLIFSQKLVQSALIKKVYQLRLSLSIALLKSYQTHYNMTIYLLEGTHGSILAKGQFLDFFIFDVLWAITLLIKQLERSFFFSIYRDFRLL